MKIGISGERWARWDLESPTDNHSSYRRLVKDPSGGHVRDADPAVAIANGSQGSEELLEKRPIAPRFQYHIEVLNSFGIGKIEGGGGCRTDRIEENRLEVREREIRSPERNETLVTNLSLGWCERSIIELRFRHTQPRISKETSALSKREEISHQSHTFDRNSKNAKMRGTNGHLDWKNEDVRDGSIKNRVEREGREEGGNTVQRNISVVPTSRM